MNDTNYMEDAFAEYLKGKKRKHTAERDAIFDKIRQTTELFSLDSIWKQLDDDNFRVSRASIYNTIELLLDAKIVVRHLFSPANVQYELKCFAEQHHYTICTTCGAVGVVENGKLNRHFSRCKIPRFTSEYYTLYFYGICSKCKYKLQLNGRQETNDNEQ